MLKATRLLARELGGHVFLLAEADQGPFSLAAQIVGIEEFLMALVTPEKKEQVKTAARYRGIQAGVRHAEAFRRYPGAGWGNLTVRELP